MILNTSFLTRMFKLLEYNNLGLFHTTQQILVCSRGWVLMWHLRVGYVAVRDQLVEARAMWPGLITHVPHCPASEICGQSSGAARGVACRPARDRDAWFERACEGCQVTDTCNPTLRRVELRDGKPAAAAEFNVAACDRFSYCGRTPGTSKRHPTWFSGLLLSSTDTLLKTLERSSRWEALWSAIKGFHWNRGLQMSTADYFTAALRRIRPRGYLFLYF